MSEYRDQGTSDIQKKVEKKYREIKEEKGRIKNAIVRDDKRARQAWWRVMQDIMKDVKDADVINSYDQKVGKRKQFKVIDKEYYVVENWKAVLKTTRSIHRNDAIKFFENASKKIYNIIQSMKDWDSIALLNCRRSEKHTTVIQKVVQDINEAEEEALLNIEKHSNPIQAQENAAYHQTIAKNEKGDAKVNAAWKIEKKDPMYTSYSWKIKFTSTSNNVNFSTATDWLFKPEYVVVKKNKETKYPAYEIDYTNCKNANIKAKMKNNFGKYKAIVFWDPKQKNYFITWGWVTKKASEIWIYEWVTMKRTELNQYEAHLEDRERKKNLWNVNVKNNGVSPEQDPELKEYVRDIPKELRIKLRWMWNEVYRSFIKNTENRLASTLREKRKYWYNFQGWDIVDDDLKIHFTISDGYGEGEKQSVKFEYSVFNNKNLKDLFWLKTYKKCLKEYLTNRTKALRDKFEELAPKWDLLRDDEDSEGTPMSEEKLGLVGRWIFKLREFFNVCKNKEWKGSDNILLNEMIKIIDNLESTINLHWKTVSESHLRRVIDLTASKLASTYPQYHSSWNAQIVLLDIFLNILLGEENLKNSELRKLSVDAWFAQFLTQNWTTSFIVDDLLSPDENGNARLVVADIALDDCFQRIYSDLNVELTSEWRHKDEKSWKAMRRIDKLYNVCDDGSWIKIMEQLEKMNMIPMWSVSRALKNGSWTTQSLNWWVYVSSRLYDFEYRILGKCEELAKDLQKKKQQIEMAFSEKTMKDSLKKAILELKQQDTTPEQINELEKLESFISDPKLFEQYCKEVRECSEPLLKYYWINGLVGSKIGAVFLEQKWALGGDHKRWEAWKLYNDIKWIWFRDLSDTTVSIIGEILADLPITIASSLIGAGVAKLAAWLVWKLLAKLASLCPKLCSLLRSITTTIAVRGVAILDQLSTKWKYVVDMWMAALKSSPDAFKWVPQTFFGNLMRWKELNAGLSVGAFFGCACLNFIGWGIGSKFQEWAKKFLTPVYEAIWNKIWEDNIKKICDEAWKKFCVRLRNITASNESIQFEISNIKDDDIFPRRTFMDVNKLVSLQPWTKLKISNKVINKKTKKVEWTEPIEMWELSNIISEISELDSESFLKVLSDKNLEFFRWTRWELFTYNNTTRKLQQIHSWILNDLI